MGVGTFELFMVSKIIAQGSVFRMDLATFWVFPHFVVLQTCFQQSKGVSVSDRVANHRVKTRLYGNPENFWCAR